MTNCGQELTFFSIKTPYKAKENGVFPVLSKRHVDADIFDPKEAKNQEEADHQEFLETSAPIKQYHLYEQQKRLHSR